MKRKILIVEDNRDSAESLAMLLELMGVEARIATDGYQALAEVSVCVPDMILMNIGLPGISGYEVAKKLRLQPALQSLTLVALTGYGDYESRCRVASAGFDHHILKPIDLDTLRSLLAAPDGRAR